MSNPTVSDVHVDAALTQLAIDWGAQQYVWDQFAPVVPVDKQSDKYYIFDKDALRRDEAVAPRAPGTLAGRGGYKLSTDSYFCTNWAWGKQITDETRQNADPVLRLSMDQKAAGYTTEVVNRRIEIQQASEIFTASVWGTDITGVTSNPSSTQAVQWDRAESTPIEDIRARADAIQLATGYRPNRLGLGRQVYSKLQDHPDLLDRMSTATTRAMKLALLAELFEVEQVVIGQASYNTAAQEAAASNSFVHGKHALLYYVPNMPAIDVPSAMYSFRWGPRSVLNYRDAPAGVKADVVETHDYVGFKVTSTALGNFFSGIIA